MKIKSTLTQITPEDVENIISEYVDMYERKHTAWIHLEQGNTYVGFDTYDIITEMLMWCLEKLMELMIVEYSISVPFGDDKKYYFVIEGEDTKRNKFIQNFIDNGYKLSW